MRHHMTTGPIASSAEVDHPTLGPSVAIYDDRRGATRHLLMSSAMAAGGVLGIVVGGNDLRTADGSTGSLLVFMGILVLIYGATEVIATLRRLRTGVRLIVGNGGFEDTSIVGPVGWDEVESIGFEKVGRGLPNAVKVQLREPRDFAGRHRLSRTARLILRMNNGALYLARGALMPTADVLELMGSRLAEFLRDREPHVPTRQRIRRRTSRP
jgi:hypothetical protein